MAKNGLTIANKGASEDTENLMYFASDSPGLVEPSNRSRALIHESLHFYRSRTEWGTIWNNMPWGHGVMDGKARQLNVQYGFGKCGAVSEFPGC